jgi:hypothetical protein
VGILVNGPACREGKYGVKNGVESFTSIVEATYLLSTRPATFRMHELYLGLFTELGNLNIDDRLRKATDYGFTGSTKGNVR